MVRLTLRHEQNDFLRPDRTKPLRLIADAELLRLRHDGCPLEGHPLPRSSQWVDTAATGSLGQGICIGVGVALAAK